MIASHKRVMWTEPTRRSIRSSAVDSTVPERMSVRVLRSSSTRSPRPSATMRSMAGTGP